MAITPALALRENLNSAMRDGICEGYKHENWQHRYMSHLSRSHKPLRGVRRVT